MRSGIEICDCEFIRANARPDSLKGMPVKSPGFGPAPRSSASSWFLDCHEPERSTCASAGRPAQRNNAAARLSDLRVILDSPFLPFRGARCGIPTGTIGLFLEVRRDDERLAKILGVIRYNRDHQHQVAVMLLDHVVILGELRIFAIRNAVFPQVAGLEVRGD